MSRDWLNRVWTERDEIDFRADDPSVVRLLPVIFHNILTNDVDGCIGSKMWNQLLSCVIQGFLFAYIIADIGS